MDIVEIIGVLIGVIGGYLSLRESMLKKLSESETKAQKIAFDNDRRCDETESLGRRNEANIKIAFDNNRRCDETESLGRRNEANIKMLFFLLEFFIKNNESIQGRQSQTGIDDIPISTEHKESSGNNT